MVIQWLITIHVVVVVGETGCGNSITNNYTGCSCSWRDWMWKINSTTSILNGIWVCISGRQGRFDKIGFYWEFKFICISQEFIQKFYLYKILASPFIYELLWRSYKANFMLWRMKCLCIFFTLILSDLISILHYVLMDNFCPCLIYYWLIVYSRIKPKFIFINTIIKLILNLCCVKMIGVTEPRRVAATTLATR